MKRIALAVLALGVLVGCGTAALRPVTVPTFDPSSLPAWNYSLTVDGKTNICPFCHQNNIQPRYAKDGAGHECLAWSCGNCGASWATRVAGPNIPK